MKVLVKISVDSDVIEKYKISDTSAISFLILVYLNDPDGWGKHKYYFQETDHGE